MVLFFFSFFVIYSILFFFVNLLTFKQFNVFFHKFKKFFVFTFRIWIFYQYFSQLFLKFSRQLVFVFLNVLNPPSFSLDSLRFLFLVILKRIRLIIISRIPNRFLVFNRNIYPQKQIKISLFIWICINITKVSFNTSYDFTKSKTFFLSHSSMVSN